MHKILFWLFFAKIKMATCLPEVNKSGFKNGNKLFEITKVGQLSAPINESSGLAKVYGKASFWTHNDGGGQTELYEINSNGQLISTLNIPNISNIDWEDLAHDNAGTIFIGDFGNNSNTRKDLTIYKFNQNQPEKTEKINFRYADQSAFPPQKQDLNFDCEAFFWANDSLYLFTKNRGEKSTNLYALPSTAGNYTISPKAAILLKGSITAADSSPDRKQFALLSYGKLYIFGIENKKISFEKPLFCIKAPLKQSEAISYISDNEILITNEQKEIFKIEFNKK
ncbi:MAG: hypothetical protein V4683_00175 [Bacteroidota bacterium]